MENSLFEKPERIVVNALAHLSEILKNGLKKDLQKHQRLCGTCKGTGLEITNQIYGLSNDPDKTRHLPYSNQYIVSCRHCYTGVVNLCEYCNEELPRFTTRCECEEAKSEQESRIVAKEKELWDKAIKLEATDYIAKNMGMYYSEDYPYNEGYFSEFYGFLEAWEDNHEPDEPKPVYVWGTYSVNLSLNAEDILESACDDLHEEASSHIVDKKELQEFLDKWSSKQSGTTTYYQDNKYAIRIPWDN